ncbi:putative nuclease HARBI1 [Penaeus vannamei]|uniref:putative nuclease HARBI1 n=1 Tax=Penaeus vannamei TaxID=6689 RepID=UPI00387F48A3
MSGFPGVLGAIDCTHVPIQSPGGARAEEFRCDSACPLLPFLLTPVANPVGQREVRYNISYSKARNTVERAFGVLKMRFRCLTIPLKINLTVMATICSAAVLHNMAVKYKEDLYMCNDDGEEESVNIEENIEHFVNAAG